MKHEDVARRLEQFIREHFAVPASDRRFSRTAPLFELAYVDSVGVAELVVFIEGEFGVTLPDEDLLSEEFDTIDGIARVVCRRGGHDAVDSVASRRGGRTSAPGDDPGG